MSQISLIACISQDGGIGQQGKLLWQIPEDMQFFRRTTMGHPVVMGGKTYASIGRALPGRENIVLAHHQPDDPQITWFDDSSALMEYVQRQAGEVMIIGGATLYQMFLPLAATLYLTEVAATKPADTYFPSFDRQRYHAEVLQSGNYESVPYRIVKYQLQNPGA